MSSYSMSQQRIWSRLLQQWMLILFGLLTLNGCPSNHHHSQDDFVKSIEISVASGAEQGSSNAQVPKGLTRQYKAVATYGNGSKKDVTNSVNWATSNLTIASFSSTGLLTSHNEGQVTLLATMETIQSNSLPLTISKAVLQKLQVTPATKSLPKGITQQYTAIGTLSDSTTMNLTNNVQWKSSNTGSVTIDDKGLARTPSAGESIISASIGNISSNPANITVTNASLTAIEITAPKTNLIEGLSQQYTATGTYTDNSTQNISNEVTWTSSDDKIAAVNTAGLVQGKTAGTSTISANLNGINSNQLTLTVADAQLVSIAITPPSPSIPKGTTQQFTAIGTYDNQTTSDITGAVTWKSSDTDNASITSKGLASGIKEGKSTIQAIMGRITSNSTDLTVSAAKLTAIQITPPAPSIAKGNNQAFTAVGTYTDNSTKNITNSVSWNSSDTSKVTIGMDGIANGVNEGQITINAIEDNVRSNDATLTVTPAVITQLQISAPSNTVIEGNTLQYTATATYSDKTSANLTNTVSWSSSDTSKATITPQGLVSGINDGSVNISANTNGVKSNTLALAITNARLTSIQITPATSNIAKGLTQQFTAEGTFDNGKVVDISNSVSWMSDDSNTVTIGTNGLATAANEGTTAIKAVRDGVTSNAANFTVTAATLTAIQIEPATFSLAKGLTRQFVATGTYTDNSTSDISNKVSWQSSDTSKVTVDANGLATGANVGQVTIKASMNSITSNTANFTVTAATLQSIQVTANTLTVPKGNLAQFTATATLTDGTTNNITSEVAWKSSDITKATIVAGGNLTSQDVGTTIITASLNGVTSNQATFTVTAAELTAIQIEPGALSIAKGRSRQYTATGTYTDNSTANISSSVNWTSADTSKMTITGTGQAAAVAEGTTTISAALSGVTSNTSNITVTAAVIESIQVTPVSPTVIIGNTQQLVATATYSDNTTSVETNNVSWSSSDSSIATISGSGVVSPVAAGTSAIKANIGSIQSNTVNITVEAPSLTSITISSTDSSTPKGDTEQLTAMGSYNNGTTTDITNSVNWSSSDTDIATVTPAGLLRGVNVGNVTIKANQGGVSSNDYSFTVDAAALTKINIGGFNGDTALPVGGSLQFYATGLYSDNLTRNITNSVNWNSSDTSVATINSSGLISSVALGTTNIKANLDGINSADATVTVAEISGITITSQLTNILPTVSFALKATGHINGASDIDITRSVNWSSSDISKATVNNLGYVRAVSLGSVTITARIDSSVSQTININVVSVLSPCGSGVGDTDQNNALTGCIKVAQRGNKLFTGAPSVNALRAMDYDQRGEASASGNIYSGEINKFGLMRNTGSPTIQRDFYCADLASKSFYSRNNWRVATLAELQDFRTQYPNPQQALGWAQSDSNGTSYLTSGTDAIALSTGTVRPIIQYDQGFVSCVSENP